MASNVTVVVSDTNPPKAVLRIGTYGLVVSTTLNAQELAELMVELAAVAGQLNAKLAEASREDARRRPDCH